VSIGALQEKLGQFAQIRDWEQFHTPKNLAMALAGEVGELLEIFQWLTPSDAAAVMSDKQAAPRVRDELADVFGYLLRLADVLNVDLEEALAAKLERNEGRYPVELARGNALKHDQLRRG
jgi:NTP pyrophosphatase (non-canonical NTP hydrolase)